MPAAGAASLAPSAASGYALTELGTLGGDYSAASFINDRGQVAGEARTSAGETHAFLWQDGAMIDLGTLGGSESHPQDLNGRGHVVGYGSTADGQYHAFLWRDGAMTDLGTLGGSESVANSVNEDGLVVGVSMTSAGEYHGFLWKDGVMTDLGSLGGVECYPIGINKSGQVAGYSQLSTGEYHAFLWQEGAMTDLGTLGGTESVATDINDRGQIVGYSGAATWQMRPFLWERGAMSDLGALENQWTYANRINGNGQAVGSSMHKWYSTSVACSFKGGAVLPLETPQYSQSVGLGINSRGQIVGHVRDFWSQGGLAVLWEGGRMNVLPGSGVGDIAYAINDRGTMAGMIIAASGKARAALWTVKGGRSESAAAASSRPAEAATLRVRSALGVLPVVVELPGTLRGTYTARVYDVRGRLVRQWEGLAAAGATTTWDGRGGDGSTVRAGVYFLALDLAGRRSSAKVVIAR